MYDMTEYRKNVRSIEITAELMIERTKWRVKMHQILCLLLPDDMVFDTVLFNGPYLSDEKVYFYIEHEHGLPGLLNIWTDFVSSRENPFEFRLGSTFDADWMGGNGKGWVSHEKTIVIKYGEVTQGDADEFREWLSMVKAEFNEFGQ